MRYQGILKQWNGEKGFGFIRPDDGGKDIFIHISDFPKDGVSPRIGEQIRYEINLGKTGKPQASFIERLDIQPMQKRKISVKVPSKTNKHQQNMSGLISIIFAFILITAIGYFAYGKYQRYQLAQQEASSLVNLQNNPVKTTSNSSFKCDGRTHCSQMHSYEEAVYFINHCPGTQMDGNNDGEPCESQFSR